MDHVDHLTVKYLNLLGFGIKKVFMSSWFILTLDLDSPSTSSSPNSPVWAQSRGSAWNANRTILDESCM